MLTETEHAQQHQLRTAAGVTLKCIPSGPLLGSVAVHPLSWHGSLTNQRFSGWHPCRGVPLMSASHERLLCCVCLLHIKLVFPPTSTQPVSVLMPHREKSSVVTNYETETCSKVIWPCNHATPTAMSKRAKTIYASQHTRHQTTCRKKKGKKCPTLSL